MLTGWLISILISLRKFSRSSFPPLADLSQLWCSPAFRSYLTCVSQILQVIHCRGNHWIAASSPTSLSTVQVFDPTVLWRAVWSRLMTSSSGISFITTLCCNVSYKCLLDLFEMQGGDLSSIWRIPLHKSHPLQERYCPGFCDVYVTTVGTEFCHISCWYNSLSSCHYDCRADHTSYCSHSCNVVLDILV